MQICTFLWPSSSCLLKLPINDADDSSVVCRKLGYQANGEEILKNGVYGPFSGPAWQSNLQCTEKKCNGMCSR